MTERLTPRALQALFLEKAEAKHAEFVPAYNKLKELVTEKGGTFSGDHIALRTTDERVANLLIQIGQIMNLHRPQEETQKGIGYPYRFPDKRLKSFDLLGEKSRDLKLFVSVWDESVTQNPAIKDAIRQDADLKYTASLSFYEKALFFVEQAHTNNGLTQSEAEEFTDIFVNHILTRNGDFLSEETYRLVATESGELASAMVLGEGINHFTVDVHKSGFTSTEALRLSAKEAGLNVLPSTSGREGWLLQSATIAEQEDITLRGKNGELVPERTPLRFMEFIDRPVLKDEDGNPLLESDGQTELYRRFEQTNAADIFSAARVSHQAVA